MDMITSSLVEEFARSFKYIDLRDNEKFEHFSAWITVRRHFSEHTFKPSDIITGGGDDTGIDALAIIVNNNIVTDKDEVEDLLEINGFLDVSFIFVQADRSPHFDGGKIGNFGAGVRDFFGAGNLRRNSAVENYAEIMKAIYSRSSKFRFSNPSCHLYYVTTGTWHGDQNLEARATAEKVDLQNTNMFSTVDFIPVGSSLIQKLYRETTNTISREFVFEKKTIIPEVRGVTQAYLGFLGAKDFLRLILDDDGKIIKRVFYENIRDWNGYNKINTEIKDTLSGNNRDRFILMNNGVTIITKTLQTTGNKFSMTDFQVVNGCQTGHVLHDNQGLIDDSVMVPVRLICTRDDGVIESIIRATNRQTAVREDQFFALKEFAKQLETYFRSFPPEFRLYYERRMNQYDYQDIDKSRIIAHLYLVRAVGAMFFEQPHITTKDFKALEAKVGKEMFIDTDKMEPYYVAAYLLYRLETSLGKKIDIKYKAARYQILLSARIIMDGANLPRMNANDMSRRCKSMIELLWNNEEFDRIIDESIARFDRVAGDGWDRYSIRTERITKLIVSLDAQAEAAS